jgi:hypothetical protein
MRSQSLIIVLVILCLVSCAAPATPSAPPASNTPQIPASSTPTIAKTSRPTPTSTPTRTPPPSLTPAPTADVRLVRRCLQEDNQEVALKAVTSGTILQDDALLDIQTGRKYPLPFRLLKSTEFADNHWFSKDRYRVLVSPNGKRLVYLEMVEKDQKVFWVVDARAKVLAKISFKRTDLNFPRWLDNERVIVYTDQTDQDGSMLVINPFTREQTTVSNELPIFSALMQRTAISWLIEYGPDLNWVAYIDDNLMTTVRDVLTQKTLWQAPLADYESLPAWSLDGQQVAIAGNTFWLPSPADQQVQIEWKTQLYLIDRSGQVKSILPERGGQPSNFFAPVWSPDGRQLAFWKANSSVDDLMVYDWQSSEVIDTCVSNDSSPYHNPVRWSPDGQQLVTYRRQAIYTTQEGWRLGFIQEGSLRVVDLQKGVVYTNLKEQNLEPNAWMSSIP